MTEKVLNDNEGQLLIKIARENIEAYLNNEDYNITEELPEIFHENLGVFVTLNINNNLRGCIGYPEPVKPLIDAVLDVSIASAVEDPRFPPLTINELNSVDIEISVLTKPKPVKVSNPDEYLEKIVLGRDGLIIEYAFRRGLLLPQVPIEQNWSIEEFLTNLCYKAGLSQNTWKEKDAVIYSFQAQIFNEIK